MEKYKLELKQVVDYYNFRRRKAKLKGLPPAIYRQQALSVAWTVFVLYFCLTFWGQFKCELPPFSTKSADGEWNMASPCEIFASQTGKVAKSDENCLSFTFFYRIQTVSFPFLPWTFWQNVRYRSIRLLARSPPGSVFLRKAAASLPRSCIAAETLPAAGPLSVWSALCTRCATSARSGQVRRL